MYSTREHINRKLREKVKQRYNGRCGYCGTECVKIYIDHIVPHSDKRNHFPNHESNLMPSCYACNNFKNAHSVEQFRIEMSKQVERARFHSANFRNAERFGLIKYTDGTIIFYFEIMERKNEIN